jgi:hypothetical protein
MSLPEGLALQALESCVKESRNRYVGYPRSFLGLLRLVELTVTLGQYPKNRESELRGS